MAIDNTKENKRLAKNTLLYIHNKFTSSIRAVVTTLRSRKNNSLLKKLKFYPVSTKRGTRKHSVLRQQATMDVHIYIK